MTDFIDQIWIDNRALDFPLTRSITEKCVDIPRETIRDDETIQRFQKLTLTRGKKILYLIFTVFPGILRHLGDEKRG